MIKKIVISHFNNIAAIMQNNKTQEIISVDYDYQINDIYLGSVRRIFASINAAFIDLGSSKRSGFIHINDLKFLKKSYSHVQIVDKLSINQLVMVQVVKEPTLNKGPRLTTKINLFGRYIILMPFCNTINVSRKIYDQNERSYLQALAILLKPATMGLSIRSAARGVSEEILLQDLSVLKKQWHFMQKLSIVSSCPCLLYRDEDLIKKIVRDFYQDQVKLVVADSENSLERFRYYLERWDCSYRQPKVRLQLYNRPESILDHFNINRAIFDALQPKVTLNEGSYLFIETYEALTVIDVNSGSFNKAENSREAVLRTNCYAATEIAYQLKIRNINGIVIIDFIDMDSHRDQLQLLEHFTRVLSFDTAQPQIIQLSKLGLVELTRRRRNQSLLEFFHGMNNKSLINNISSSSTFSLSQITRVSLVHKSINSLFFSILLHKFIIVSGQIHPLKHHFMVISNYKLYFLYLRYTIIVPMIVYSNIIDIRFLH
uniref:Ribonuclease E n=1 Tax=Neogoniolithon spectabile TaxID=231755 RepID=A0A3G3MH37_9FLOR|nr:ribonuclease E [Neogoniolithon spectabile]AYR06144.1 ribonuclease E [Neogoniolithon spectabile]